jgi:rhodanese-related sulfurtransferase
LGLVFSQSRTPSVTAADVASDAYLLDIREQDEWDGGHAPDAHHLPMSELLARIDELPTDEDVIVVCRSGNRSGQVVSYMAAQGRSNLINLDGGMLDWVAAGRPIVADDGRDPYIV